MGDSGGSLRKEGQTGNRLRGGSCCHLPCGSLPGWHGRRTRGRGSGRGRDAGQPQPCEGPYLPRRAASRPSGSSGRWRHTWRGSPLCPESLSPHQALTCGRTAISMWRVGRLPAPALPSAAVHLLLRQPRGLRFALPDFIAMLLENWVYVRKSGCRSQPCHLDALSVHSLSRPASTGPPSEQRCQLLGEKYKPQRTRKVRPAGFGRTTRVPETPRAASPSFRPFCVVGTRCRGVIFRHEDDVVKCLKGLRCLFLALLHTI